MFNPRCRFFNHPTNRAVGVVVQITEGTFGYSVTETGCTSPPGSGFSRGSRSPERSMFGSACQPSHLAHDRSQWTSPQIVEG